jgi:hypothetical protein
VPEQLIEQHISGARIREDYTARELDVIEGEEVVLEREVNGWAWCHATNGSSGWVPAKNLERSPS